MNFINCLLDAVTDDSGRGFSDAITDRARQMAGIDSEEISFLDSD